MFQIVEAFPRFCSITDGIIGTGYIRHPMTYHRADAAHAIAGLKERANYDRCGDSSFFVIEAGAPVLNRMGRENRIDTGLSIDDCPF